MSTNRIIPLPSYNFLVNLGGRPQDQPLGGFSDVTGLKTELHISEYRNGNDKNPHVHKYPGVHTVGDVTLKRGVVDSSDFWTWITDTRTNGGAKQRDVVITVRDEAGEEVQKFRLTGASPKGYTGPVLNAKGTGDLAIEELVLAVEGFEVVTA
jgi:phage tail-like protein